ncbi:hypothetical protein, partial [Sulfuricurvum sp.]|uniref:hypothetical protein n=1 Tax=Sulfuricurvum sp. TaxID=2025608 RepID=UPI002E3565AA
MPQENNIETVNGAVAEHMHQPVFNFNPPNKESKLRKLLNLLLKHDASTNNPPNNCIEYDIEQKIEYNDVDEDWQGLIEEYYSFDKIFSTALNIANPEGIMNKSIFLGTLKQYYVQAKNALLDNPKDQEEIKQKSTQILNYVSDLQLEFL